MGMLGILISKEEVIKGTFLDSDSEAVGIMMQASGESACMSSG